MEDPRDDETLMLTADRAVTALPMAFWAARRHLLASASGRVLKTCSGLVRKCAGEAGWVRKRDGEGVNFCASASSSGLRWDRNRTETLLPLPSFSRLKCRPEKRFLIAYVWEHGEVARVLGNDAAAIFSFQYGIERNGNVRSDPQGEFPRKNVLYVAHSIEDTANRFNKTPEAMRELLAEAHANLLIHRASCPRPHLDDKTLTVWNGLTISAFTRAAQVFDEPRYRAAAQKAAAFIETSLYEKPFGALKRRYRQGEVSMDGFADDYAFLIQGLLDLYEANFDVQHLDWAIALQQKQDELFWDEDHGGYFNATGRDRDVLLRMKDDYDGAEPSANSVSALNLLRLAQMTDQREYSKRAEEVFSAFAHPLSRAPRALPAMLAALDFQLGHPKLIVIAGKPGSVNTLDLLRTTHTRFIPSKVLFLADGGQGQKMLARHYPFIFELHPIDGKAPAYVCENGACQFPATDPAILRQQLAKPDGKQVD